MGGWLKCQYCMHLTERPDKRGREYNYCLKHKRYFNGRFMARLEYTEYCFETKIMGFIPFIPETQKRKKKKEEKRKYTRRSKDLFFVTKREYQYTYWLKKAKEYGIPTEGREDEARKEAEARYRKEYRRRGVGSWQKADTPG